VKPLREADLPLVRGGKIPKEALLWLAAVERVFPRATKDIIIVRDSSSAPLREAETGGKPIAQQEKADDHDDRAGPERAT
jgi:hypothetical protein